MNDELKDVRETICGMLEWIEKARKAADMLRGWKKRREIGAPPKQIEDKTGDLDDALPFQGQFIIR
ncbi:hypothetical protein [Dongia sp.]|uniref:hypothetical protein n=1 Tax=Dongia sp. TaxID=1977262 RepID=UPI0035B16F95